MKLMDHLPWQVYHNDEHVAELQEAVNRELWLLQQARDDLYLQLRPSTSTWGMSNYEREYAIQPVEGKSRELRLAGWRAKRRGRSTTTEALIISVAESFTSDPVAVLVYPSEYAFELRLPDSGRMPEYLYDLIKVIWEIRPAHLGMVYRLPLRTCDSVHVVGAGHQRVRHRLPLDVQEVETPESKIGAVGAGHIRLRQRIGGSDA